MTKWIVCGLCLLASVLPSTKTFAQCVSNGRIVANVYNTTGNTALDLKIGRVTRSMSRLFKVRAGVYILDDPRCSSSSFSTPHTQYRGTYGSVYLSLKLLKREFAKSGKREKAVRALIAHAYASLLLTRRRSRLRGKLRSLMADVLAGWALARTKSARVKELRGLTRRLFFNSEYAYSSGSQHGIPFERIKAMHEGFRVKKRSLKRVLLWGQRFVRRHFANSAGCFRSCQRKRRCQRVYRCYPRRRCKHRRVCRIVMECRRGEARGCLPVRRCRRVQSCRYIRHCRWYRRCGKTRTCTRYCRN